MFDAFKNESFRLHAMLFCTINDFPTYGNLSGYSVKGYKTYPTCEEKTSYEQLKHERKTVYLEHYRFLTKYHLYRRLEKAFNGYQEHDIFPTPLSGLEIYEKIKNVNVLDQSVGLGAQVVTLRLCDNVTECLPIKPTFTRDKVLVRGGLLQ